MPTLSKENFLIGNFYTKFSVKMKPKRIKPDCHAGKPCDIMNPMVQDKDPNQLSSKEDRLEEAFNQLQNLPDFKDAPINTKPRSLKKEDLSEE
ncbi:hypothetical protein Tco_0839285 [Tanacetum coccineum]|uniref:Uncharacterized protein n=1 Tax=Tanacetum coccineum TaxID=301880 RepID=A0ABQ5AR37_9ASTR